LHPSGNVIVVTRKAVKMEVVLKILIPILITIESGGDTKAIGDNGKAVGCLQIHKMMVDDVNRIIGAKTFDYQDRYDKEASIEMAKIYFRHYIKKTQRLSLEDQLVFMGRSWVGGPNGPNKVASIPYGEKVRELYQSIEKETLRP